MREQPEALRLADALVRPDDSLRLADGNYLMPQAAAELRRLHAELAVAEYALRSKGYRKSCEISACNCGNQWNHGGNAEARLRELSSELHGSPVDMNGKTLLAGLSELVERADKAEAEAERLRADAERWRYFVTHCQWFRHHDEDGSYSTMSTRLPYDADQSCVATRNAAIDAARTALKETK